MTRQSCKSLTRLLRPSARARGRASRKRTRIHSAARSGPWRTPCTDVLRRALTLPALTTTNNFFQCWLPPVVAGVCLECVMFFESAYFLELIYSVCTIIWGN